MSLEDLVNVVASDTLQFQQERRNAMKILVAQVSQLVTTIGGLEAQGFGKLPSQPVVNLRENVSVITL